MEHFVRGLVALTILLAPTQMLAQARYTPANTGPTHWYEHLRGTGNRPWLITDPADGKLPPMTPQALEHEAAAAALNDARNGEGRVEEKQ